MLVLLPPSETKRKPEELAAHQLHKLRADSATATPALKQQLAVGGRDAAAQQVLEALQQLSALADDKAHKSLKLRPGAKAAAAFAANRSVTTAVRLPAAAIYTGVLYDALDYLTLPTPAQQWVHEHVAIQSALYGLLGAGELIANYRLSASSSLPALGTTLKKHWNSYYALLDWGKFNLVLDLRSQDYAALAPCAGETVLQPEFVSRQPDGSLRALNHFNKAGKGRLVRDLAQAGADFSTVAEALEWIAANGIEVVHQPSGKIMFVL